MWSSGLTCITGVRKKRNKKQQWKHSKPGTKFSCTGIPGKAKWDRSVPT